MDMGEVTSSYPLAYIASAKRTFWSATTNHVRVDRANACPQCGYIELFLDPAELRDILAGE